MYEETVVGVLETLLNGRDPSESLIPARVADEACESGEFRWTPDRGQRLYSLLSRSLKGHTDGRSYRVVGRHASFLLAVSADGPTVSMTLMNAATATRVARLSLSRERGEAKALRYAAVLFCRDTTPFGVTLLDSLMQSMLAPGGLGTYEG